MGGRRAKIDRETEESRSYSAINPARDNLAQSEVGLIGHRYLEKCKVGLQRAGREKTEWYNMLLIG